MVPNRKNVDGFCVKSLNKRKCKGSCRSLVPFMIVDLYANKNIDLAVKRTCLLIYVAYFKTVKQTLIVGTSLIPSPERTMDCSQLWDNANKFQLLRINR